MNKLFQSTTHMENPEFIKMKENLKYKNINKIIRTCISLKLTQKITSTAIMLYHKYIYLIVIDKYTVPHFDISKMSKSEDWNEFVNHLITAVILLSCKLNDFHINLKDINKFTKGTDVDIIQEIELTICEFLDFEFDFPDIYQYFNEYFKKLEELDENDGFSEYKMIKKNEIMEIKVITNIIINDSFYLPFIFYLSKKDIFEGSFEIAKGVFDINKFSPYSNKEKEFFIREMLDFYERN